MKRIPFPADVSDTTRRYPRSLEQAFGPYQRQSPIVPMADHDSAPPPIWPFLFICALAVVLALLTGCSGADAGQEPRPVRLQDQQEQRQAAAAAHACGPGMTAIWHDTTTMQCMREITP